MKKIFSILIIILALFLIYPNTSIASNSGYFRVTAYYSPLPNQKYYIKGNYKAEKRMNWEWIRWASWKPVFSGMIAAPKKYSFGTKVYLEWLGIWEVSDRGWAIVEAWVRNFKHDRIDVWVWYWDEGLRRAMYWGNRVIKWNVVKSSNKTSIDYKKISAPYWVTNRLNKNNTKKQVNAINKIKQKTEFEIFLEKELKIFNKKIKAEDEIKNLQKKLSDLWLYKWDINWEYNSIIGIITDYQLEKKLINKSSHKAAWYFGPSTRKNLSNDYKNYLTEEKEKKEKIEQFEKEIESLKNIASKKANKKIKQIWNIKFWNISPSVRELQKTLKNLWYFNNKDTAIFWEKTKQAILDYQIDKKIIKNSYELWAWYFGPNTKKSFINELSNKYLIEEINKNKQLAEYYKNKWLQVTKLKEEENKKPI